jgi:hypothetical protein
MAESQASGEHFSVHTQTAHRRRYHGLLNRSPAKNLRDRFFRFLDFIGTIAASQSTLMFVMGIIGAFQLAIMGLIPANRHFWEHDVRPAGMCLNILSIVLYVIPVGQGDSTVLIGGLVVLVVVVAVLISIAVAFGVFSRTSQMPGTAANIVCFVFNGCLPAFACFGSTRTGWGLALLITGDHSVPLCVVNIVLGAALGGSIPFFHSMFCEFTADDAAADAADNDGFPLHIDEWLPLPRLLPGHLRVSLSRSRRRSCRLHLSIDVPRAGFDFLLRALRVCLAASAGAAGGILSRGLHADRGLSDLGLG